MQEGWKKYKISDFIEINPKVKLITNQEYSFVEMKDLDANNKSVIPSDFKKLKGGAKFQDFDTLFARITPCLQNGKICQVKGLKNGIGFGSTEFLVFRGKKKISDSDFVYYLSREPFFRQFSESNMIGTSGRQRIAKEAFENLQLELPPLQEQKAIASILSALDDKIENNLAMNKTLEDMAMALYKHWFLDFGPFQEGEFVDSELGMIPEGWEVKSIGNFIDYKKGYAFKSKWYLPAGKSIVRVSDTTHNSIDLTSCNKISDQKAIEFENFALRTNDVIIATVGSWPPNYDSVVGKVVRVPISANGCLLNQNAVKLQMNINDRNFQSILYFTLKNEKFLKYIVNRAQGSASQASIKLTDIFDYKIPFYSIDNFISFSFEIDSFVELQNQLTEENQVLANLRDTLLPKLINGEVRVKDAEKIIAEVL